MLIFSLLFFGTSAVILSSGIVSTVAPLFGRSADLTGRYYLWLEALELLSKKPLLGYGFDDHATVIEAIVFPTSHFHNGFLDLAVRGGVVAVALLIFMFMIGYKHLRKVDDTKLIIILPFTLSTVIYNLSEVTFMLNRDVLWLLMMFFLFLVLPDKKRYQ